MKKRDDLFKLIKSLTRNEKGYFKKFSKINSTESNSSYSLLFDAIDRMQTYNEDRLRKSMQNHMQLTALSTLKNYLYDLIIRSLRNYYENSDLYIKELNQQAYEHILVKKGLVEKPVTAPIKKTLKENTNTKNQNKKAEFEHVTSLSDRIRFFQNKLKNAASKDLIKIALEIELTLKKQPYLKQELKADISAKVPYFELLMHVYQILGKQKKLEKTADKLRKLNLMNKSEN